MSLCSKQFQILNSPELDSGLDVFSPEIRELKIPYTRFYPRHGLRQARVETDSVQDSGLGKKKLNRNSRSSRKLIELFFEEYPSILPVFQ